MDECASLSHSKRECKYHVGYIKGILTPIGEPTSPPRLMRAGAPPLWQMQGDDDPPAQSAPEYEVDQRVAW